MKVSICSQWLFMPILMSLVLASAEAQVLRGRIVRSGEPVAGATVQKERKSFRSISDLQGNFLVEAEPGDMLVVRQADTIWKVFAVQQMVIDLNTLEGKYPGLKKSKVQPDTIYPVEWGDTLGAVTRLSRVDFNQGNIFDPYGYLQGLVPGLTIARPGGDPLAQYDVQLRGVHNLSNFNYYYFPYSDYESFFGRQGIDRSRPLLVIDGLPSASLLTVDPASITSVRVLRDAASAAAYGLRGANGVIEIETEQRPDKPFTLTYHPYLAWDHPANLPEVLSTEEYRQRINTRGADYYHPDFDRGQQTDWQDAITREAWSHAHQLGLAGVLNQTTYQLSVNFRDQQGIALKSGFDQWNGLLRLRQGFWKQRLQIGLGGAYTERRFQDVEPVMFRQASIYNPTAPVYGDTTGRHGGYYQYPMFYYFNPVAILEQTTKEGFQKVATFNADIRLRPLPGLEIKGRYAFQGSHDLNGTVYSRDAYFRGSNSNGFVDRLEYWGENRYVEVTAAYQNAWRQHHLRVSGGYAYQRWDSKYEMVDARDFSRDDFSYDDYADAGLKEEQTSRFLDEQVAFFGRLEYQWNRMLFLRGSLRQEGASRLGPDNKWAWFPAVQSAFSIDRVLNWSNRIHFRLGYGEAGQLPSKSYAAFWNLRESDYMYYQGEFIPAYDFYNTPNLSIGEERRKEWNVGFDLGLFGNRLTLQLDWYRSKAMDLEGYTDLPVPPNTQYFYIDNFWELHNRGLELTLCATVIDRERLSWSSALQWWRNRTTLINMNHPEAIWQASTRTIGYLGGPGSSRSPQRLEEGEAIGTFFGPVFSAINGDGEWEFVDFNGDGQDYDYSDSRPIGNAQPSYQFGWQNEFKWGNLDVQFMLRGVVGHEQINTHRFYYGVPNLLPYNLLTSAFTGDDARLRDYPRFSSYYIEDASFLRLEFLTLGYNFALRPRATLGGLRVYLTAQRLFTITGYSGTDPEQRLENEGNYLVPGIDGPNAYYEGPRGFYYPNRTIVFGLSLKL